MFLPRYLKAEENPVGDSTLGRRRNQLVAQLVTKKKRFK